MATENLDMDYSKYDFKDSTEMYVHLSKKGLTKDTVIGISKMKDEPQWMLDFRLRSFEIFMKKPMPTWGGDLSVQLIFKTYTIMQKHQRRQKRTGMTFLKMSKIPLTNSEFLRLKRSSWQVWAHNMNPKLSITISEKTCKNKAFYF